MSVLPVEEVTLEGFLEYIYGDATGYVYVALKKPGNESQFIQHFFQWPAQVSEIVSLIRDKRSDYEVYYAPSLFREKSSQKEYVSGANVVWCEFDGNAPESFDPVPEPSLRIQSSTPGHEHCYWRLDSFTSPYDIEKINRAITYALGADVSGWDASQILRPLETYNHKREKAVELLSMRAEVYGELDFASLPDPPPPVDVPVPESVPDVPDVISKYKFPKTVWQLFKKGGKDRSASLVALAYHLAEMQMKNEEILAMLLNADARWGKYHGRNDQLKRLMEIVTRARAKYPLKQNMGESRESLVSIGFVSLLKTEVNLEWVWEGLLQKGGYFLLTGPSGVGKTQFSLDAASRFILEERFLGRNIPDRQKIGFFSLEMGLVDLKYFLQQQASGYTEEELELLEQNLRIFPLGEPLYLNRDEEKKLIEEVIEREQLTGVIFDSLGSVTEESLSQEADIKNLMDWNDQLRQRTGVFSWFIHHHRKATGENKKPNKLSDVYGNQYITARATTVMALWDVGIINTVQVLPLKIRLSEKPSPFNIYRDGRLRFTIKQGGITVVEEGESDNEITKQDSEEFTDEDAAKEKDGRSPGEGLGGF